MAPVTLMHQSLDSMLAAGLSGFSQIP